MGIQICKKIINLNGGEVTLKLAEDHKFSIIAFSMKMAIAEDDNKSAIEMPSPIPNGDEFNLSEILDRNDESLHNLGDNSASFTPHHAENTSYGLAKS